MRIVITGGAGFLGYHLARAAVARGDPVRLLDIAAYDPADYDPSVECLTGDVRDPKAVASALSAADVVVHAAAALPLWQRKQIHEINVEGTRNVLETARQLGVPRVIQISSTAVYGVPRAHPLYEDSPLQGVGPYGQSKIEAERLCQQFRSEGLCIPILRPKTFIGQGRLGVFQILYDWVASGQRIPMIGDGRNRYQLLEVEDLVDAIFRAATAPLATASDTFNVGATRFGTVREDLQALCDYAGSGARPMATPAPLVKAVLALFERLKLSPLYKWVYATADCDSFVSTEKIEKALDWKPRYSNAEALIRSYQWYLDHAAGIEHGTGVTHRIAWDQGILRLFKRWL